MLGTSHQIITTSQPHVQKFIDLETQSFSPHQRELAQAVVGACMAEIIWQSDTDPKAEKRYDLATVPEQVAKIIVAKATAAAHDPATTHDQVIALIGSKELRRLAAETKVDVERLLDQRARGR